MISVASEKNISMAKKRDIAPFKVNGQSHIILQQLSCRTRSKVTLWGQAQLRIFDRKFLPALKITKLVFSSYKL
jgi:hypothetical protein